MSADQRNDRRSPESKPGDLRSQAGRDRDRILYSTAFRRLAEVTQVAGPLEGHVFHNRLTHSLEVAQIGRRIAENLHRDQKEQAALWGGVDPDVVEAAALCHDLGHPPFGHIAEKALADLAEKHGLTDGFEGNAQSFRIVNRFIAHRDPRRSDGHVGANLTRATLNAILKYPWLRDTTDEEAKAFRKFGAYNSDQDAFDFARARHTDRRQSLEAAIMDHADGVAYSVHDLDDFFRAGLIPIGYLRTSDSAMDEFLAKWVNDPDAHVDPAEVERERPALERMLGDVFFFEGPFSDTFEHRALMRTTTSHLIQRYVNDVTIAPPGGDKPLVENRRRILELKFLQRLVWDYVIYNPRLATQQEGQRRIVTELFEVYHDAILTDRRSLIPPSFHYELDRDTAPARLAMDIVASLADQQAVVMYRRVMGIAPGSVSDRVDR